MKKITIGIVAYHSEECLPDLLYSIVKSTCFHALSVCILDNSVDTKTKESIQHFIKKYPSITYIKSNENSGYGRGHNTIFFNHCSTEYYYILNPDTLFDSNSIQFLYDVIQKDKSIGVVGPAVVYPDGEKQYTIARFPKIVDLFAEGFTPIQRWFGVTDRNYRHYTSTRNVDWLHGCALLCRSDIFRKVGGFDEDFYMYIEDLDLCCRIHNLGYTIQFSPETQIIHEKEGNSEKRKTQKDIWIRENYLRFFKKYRQYVRYIFFMVLIFLEKVVVFLKKIKI